MHALEDRCELSRSTPIQRVACTLLCFLLQFEMSVSFSEKSVIDLQELISVSIKIFPLARGNVVYCTVFTHE